MEQLYWHDHILSEISSQIQPREHHPFIGNAEVYFRQCIIDPFCTFTVLLRSFVKRIKMQILYPENLQPVTPDIHLYGFIHAYRRVLN